MKSESNETNSTEGGFLSSLGNFFKNFMIEPDLDISSDYSTEPKADTQPKLSQPQQFAAMNYLYPDTDMDTWKEVFGEDNVNSWAESLGYSPYGQKSYSMISYPSETNGSWRNQKSYVGNFDNGSFNGLPSYLRKGSDDINTTTYGGR